MVTFLPTYEVCLHLTLTRTSQIITTIITTAAAIIPTLPNKCYLHPPLYLLGTIATIIIIWWVTLHTYPLSLCLNYSSNSSSNRSSNRSSRSRMSHRWWWWIMEFKGSNSSSNISINNYWKWIWLVIIFNKIIIKIYHNCRILLTIIWTSQCHNFTNSKQMFYLNSFHIINFNNYKPFNNNHNYSSMLLRQQQGYRI